MSDLRVTYADREEIFPPDKVVSVGRSVDATFQISDPSISRIHFKVSFDAVSSTWELTDDGSANGCWVNGVQITSVKVSAPLEIRLGNDPLAAVVSVAPAASKVREGAVGS